MATYLEAYDKMATEYMFVVSCMQAGIMSSISDVIAQKFVEGSSLDPVRVLRSFFIGSCLMGPVMTTWLFVLEGLVPGNGPSEALQRMLLDQLTMSPAMMFALFSINELIAGNGFSGVKNRLKSEYVNAMLASYKLWPAVNFINFWMVPMQHRGLVGSSVAMLWCTYISVVMNRTTPEDKKSDKKTK